MNSTDRLKREQDFYKNRYGGEGHQREKVTKYYSVTHKMTERYDQIAAQLCPGSELLEYGCGTGEVSQKWINFGADLTGIDLSEEGIERAREKTKNAQYFVMNAEKTEFEDSKFDLILGKAIIHHLDIERCYRELSRLLNKDGHLLFLEPLGHNPLINLYRSKTPEMRTEDEHPLLMQDLTYLKDFFHNVDLEFFTLSTLLAVPFRKLPFFNPLCNSLQALDQALFKIPFIQKYAWMVIIHAYNPKNRYGLGA